MLPQKLPLDLMQVTWATQLDPVINSPLARPVMLKNVVLKAGTNVINHKLGKKLQGWFTTRVRAASTLYDQQDTNPMPDLTLTLVASADVTVDLVVY